MDHETGDPRLSRIQTYWTVIGQAHDGESAAAAAARDQLIRRYGKAVHRYLLGALRDPEAADELAQEFALRFVRGDLHRADPNRGRFRDFVKGVLFHLIDHHRRRRRQVLQELDGTAEPAAPAGGPSEADAAFLASWRAELLDRAWKALAELEESSGQPFHAVLRFRVEHGDLRSPEMAEQLGQRLNRPLTAAGFRQTLRRARDKFADFLVNEVLQTLRTPTIDQLEEELIDVGLHEYCRPALDRLRRAGP
jgi:RNA polymerase sigma-70 factor (ECF subfamily)